MEYVYAALLLHKLGKEVSEDSLKKVIAATGADVDESKVKVLVASLSVMWNYFLQITYLTHQMRNVIKAYQ